MHGHQLRLSAGEDILLPKANPICKGNIMQNTKITEYQRQSGIIKGTDTRYIKRDFYQAWLNIVQQHGERQILSPPQISFLEMVNSQSSANRYYERQRNSFNHAAYRLPQTVRG